MAKKLVAANWKENPSTKAHALRLFKAVAEIRNPRVNVLICVPSVFLEEIGAAYRTLRRDGQAGGLAIGAEDAFWEERGPFTGGVGPKILRSLGVRYVIIGHSERRKWFGETDAMVNLKMKRVLADGLTAILCVGEPRAVRRKGRRAAEEFVRSQLAKDLQHIRTGKVIVAYEPIWAIGAGRPASPDDAAAMACVIKKTLAGRFGNVKVLYGGSVDGVNAGDYIASKDIDGALVGGASLRAGEFKKIIKSI